MSDRESNIRLLERIRDEVRIGGFVGAHLEWSAGHLLTPPRQPDTRDACARFEGLGRWRLPPGFSADQLARYRLHCIPILSLGHGAGKATRVHDRNLETKAPIGQATAIAEPVTKSHD